MAGIEEIEAAFLRVKSQAERVMGGDKASKDQSYQEIFGLNNEIGKLGRERPKSMPRMKELQAYVNMITVGIKYDKVRELREGLAVTEKSIRSMKKEFAASP